MRRPKKASSAESSASASAGQYANHWASHRLTFFFVALAITLTSAVWASGASASSSSLPDGRAYEMVSPPAKGGAEVLQQTTKTHVAADGDGVTFSALSAFGTIQGTSLDAEYLSRRTGVPGTNGWTSQGINPPGRSDSILAVLLGNNNTYVDAFTPDLSTGIYRSWRPLVEAPNVTEVSNLYRVSGLGGAGGGVQLLSDGVAPMPPWSVTAMLLASPAFVGASTDLSHAVFESKLNLTADAPPYSAFCTLTNGLAGCRTRLYENASGVVRLVGRIPSAPDTACDDVNGPDCVTAPSSQAGVTPTGTKFYSETMVSDDGRRILFQTPAGADSGAIYMREDGVRTVQLAQDGQLWSASADGSRVFFTTNESLVVGDTDSSHDLYMYDGNAPASARLTLVSASSVNDGDVNTVLGASADGHYVYFVCAGQLVSGEPQADLVGLYAWHDGDLRYIGQFADLTEAGRSGPRAQYDFPSGMRTGRISPDGRHLLFVTQNDAGFRDRGGFGGYDHAGHNEAYLYSADTGRLVCASCNPSGRAATTDVLLNVREGAGASATTSKLSHALSDDGREVFFTTAEALVPEDTNGTRDAYEYDATTATVHLISSGVDASPSYFIDASNDGDNVFFATRQRLVGWDVDTSFDLYDARVHGGFPEPAAKTPECSGEACQGPLSGPPEGLAAGSTGLRGAGNATKGTRSVISGLRKLSSSDRSTLAKGGKARLRLKVNGSGTVTVTGTAKVGKKNRRVVSASARARKAGAVSIPFALSKSALSALSSKGSLTVRLTVRFKDARPKVFSVTLKSATAKKGGRS